MQLFYSEISFPLFVFRIIEHLKLEETHKDPQVHIETNSIQVQLQFAKSNVIWDQMDFIC